MQSIIQPTQLTAVVRPARLLSSVGASGDVRGPGSATDGQVALFDGPSGRRLRETPTGAVGLALLARSALTAGALLLGNGAGAPTELATTSYGRSFLGLADPAAGRSLLEVPSIAEVAAGYQPFDADLTAIAAMTTSPYGRSLLTPVDAAAGRTLLGLGTGNSPTFAGLTTTGADGIITTRVQSATGRLRLIGYLDAANGAYIDSIDSTETAPLPIKISGSKVQLANAGTEYLTVQGGVTTIAGVSPGTPGTGEARIGGGAGAFGAGVRSYLGGAAYEAIGAVGSPSYLRFDQIANAGKVWRVGNTGAGSYSSFDIYNQTDGVTALTLAATGAATFSNAMIAGYVGVIGTTGAFNIANKFGADHYAGQARLYSNGPDTGTRGGFSFLHVCSDGTNQLESLYLHPNGPATFYTTAASGTAGANEVRIGAGQINLAGGMVAGGDVTASTGSVYLGDENTTNSWRFRRSGSDLLIERHNGTSYVTKQTITG